MSATEKTTLATLRQRKQAGEKFPVLTCYDCPTAQILYAAGVDVLLVGDTVAQVVLGHADTRLASMDFMIEVTAAVRRGAPKACLIGDMPDAARFRESVHAGVTAARRFVDQAGCDLVKIELNRSHLGVLEAVRAAGIEVVAHIGLLPQCLAEFGGHKGQGKDADAAMALIEEAQRMEAAGASVLLLEAVAREVSAEIVARARVPVIGCAAGPACDATVVVLHDMLGWGVGGKRPPSVKQYADLRAVLSDAFAEYAADVREGRFPIVERSFGMAPGEYEKLQQRLGTS